MAVRRRDQAEHDLGGRGFFPEFHASVVAGISRYWEKYESDAYCTRPHTRASLIRDFIVDELKIRIDGKPRVRILEKNQTTYFCIGNWVVVVHKLHDDYTITLNRTQIALELNGNFSVQLELPEISATATVLQLGYLESLADRLMPQVFLVCPDGSTPAWFLELKPVEGPEPVEITPEDKGAPDSGVVRVRVTKLPKRTPSQ